MSTYPLALYFTHLATGQNPNSISIIHYIRERKEILGRTDKRRKKKPICILVDVGCLAQQCHCPQCLSNLQKEKPSLSMKHKP